VQQNQQLFEELVSVRSYIPPPAPGEWSVDMIADFKAKAYDRLREHLYRQKPSQVTWAGKPLHWPSGQIVTAGQLKPGEAFEVDTTTLHILRQHAVPLAAATCDLNNS
jgi:hypothetical protein